MNFGLVLVDMADPTPDIACACASSDALVGLVSVELDGLKGIVVGLKNGRRTLCVCVCVCVWARARNPCLHAEALPHSFSSVL